VCRRGQGCTSRSECRGSSTKPAGLLMNLHKCLCNTRVDVRFRMESAGSAGASPVSQRGHQAWKTHCRAMPLRTNLSLLSPRTEHPLLRKASSYWRSRLKREMFRFQMVTSSIPQTPRNHSRKSRQQTEKLRLVRHTLPIVCLQTRFK
jgi:hypothetical protein